MLTNEDLKEFYGDHIDNWPKKPFNMILSGREFHLGQCYEKHGAQQIKCGDCGSTEFHVALGSYYTAIRCKNCQIESCIHDG